VINADGYVNPKVVDQEVVMHVMQRIARLASGTFGTFLLAACGEAAAPVGPPAARPSAAVVTNTGRQPFSAALFDQCTGEVVDLAGWGRTTITETVDGAGGTHLVVHTALSLTGVGRTTGAQYVANQRVTQVVQGPPPVNEVLVARSRLISKGSLDNRFVTIRRRLVVNARGEVVVDFADSQIDCR
jgi:hypothetical protein